MEFIRIREKYPNGEGSIKDVLKWIENVDKTVSDNKDVFKMLIPVIKDSLKYEFSEANPNNWASLKRKYIQWKAKKGYPATIGIMTGALKRSLTDKAKTVISGNVLKYETNSSVTGYKGKPVSRYAKYFDKTRNVFGFTIKYLKREVKDIIIDLWTKKFKKEI